MMSKKRLYIAIAATTVAICIIGSAVFAASQNFRPDVIFKGSSLTGWHKLGQADWRADNGEIIAPPKESGGWLMLDKGYHDIAFYASFLCVGACQTGVLLRAEKIAGGMKRIYVSLAGGDIAGYEVLLDAQGKETSRTPLGPGLGMARMGGARFSGAEDLVPGFAKPAPTRAERRRQPRLISNVYWVINNRPRRLSWRQRRDLRRQAPAVPDEELALH
jgi:Domain of Unknown Function (DUF1080)